MLGLIIVSVLVLAPMPSPMSTTTECSGTPTGVGLSQAQTAQVQGQLNALAEYQALDENVRRRRPWCSTSMPAAPRVADAGRSQPRHPQGIVAQRMQKSAPPVAGFCCRAAADGQLELGGLSVEGQTYTFEDVATTIVRLDQIPSLGPVGLSLARATDELLPHPPSPSRRHADGICYQYSTQRHSPAHIAGQGEPMSGATSTYFRAWPGGHRDGVLVPAVHPAAGPINQHDRQIEDERQKLAVLQTKLTAVRHAEG